MPRSFLSVRYMGTRYAGSQVQDNAITIQGELEKALGILFREEVMLTGSSRTDAGVHAAKNFFHFDWPKEIQRDPVYQLNAILPSDIAVLEIRMVSPEAHCRFDAIGREYEYKVYGMKDPFLADRGWYFPYPLDLGLLNDAAAVVLVRTISPVLQSAIPRYIHISVRSCSRHGVRSLGHISTR